LEQPGGEETGRDPGKKTEKKEGHREALLPPRMISGALQLRVQSVTEVRSAATMAIQTTTIIAIRPHLALAAVGKSAGRTQPAACCSSYGGADGSGRRRRPSWSWDG
jgi:hypothetical protein